MSNKTISQFNTDGLLTGSEYLLGMSEGVTVKLVLDSVKNFILSGSSSGNTFVESISDDGNGIVSVDNSDPLNPIIVFSGVTTDGSTITGTGLVGDPLTVNSSFYSPADLGFIITPKPSAVINQNVILPENVDVTYPSPLTIGSGYTVTVPISTTLTII